jgi:phage-related protein
VAEAELQLDITPALQSIEEISAAFDATVAQLSADLNGVLEDALGPQITDLSAQLDTAFAGLGDQLSGAFDNVDFSAIQTPDFGGATDELESLATAEEDASVKGEGMGKAFGLAETATGALEVASGSLEGSMGGLIRTVLPGAAIFGGITAAIAGLVEKGDKAVLATKRLNDVFGDSAPKLMNDKIAGVNFSLDELDKKNGTSGASLKLLLATFGQTAIGAGATKEEAAGVAQNMGFLANAVTALNPSLGTADQNFQLLSRGLGGSTRLLQRYGITIDAAKQSELALNIAHEHGRDKASLYDKQVAGLQLSLASLNDQAKKNGTTLDQELNGALENSTVKFRALRQEVSSTLTSFAVPLVDAGLKITEAFQPAIEGIIGLFGGLVDAIVPALVPLADKISEALQPIFDKIPSLVTAVTPLITGIIDAFSPLLDLLGPIVSLLIDMGTALLRVATPFIIDFFKGVGTAIGDLVGYVRDAAEWLGTHLTGALDALQPYLDKLGINGHDIANNLGQAAVAAGAAGVAFKVFGFGLDQLSTVFQTISAGLDILLANPWIAALAIAAAAIYLLWKNSKDFRDIVHEIGDYLNTNFVPDMEDLYNTAIKIATVFGADLYDAFDATRTVINDIGDAIGGTNAFQAILDLGHAISELWDALGSVGDILLVVGAIGLLAAAFLAFGPAVGIITTVGIGVTALIGAFAGIALVAGILYENFQPVTDLFDTFGNKVGDLVDKVGSQVAPIFDRLSKVFGSAAEEIDRLIPKIETIIGTLFDIGKIVVQVILVALTPFIDLLRNVLGPVFDFLGEQITTVMNSVADIIDGSINIILGLFALVIDLLTGDWSAAWDDVKQIVEGALTFVEGIISGVLGAIENTIGLILGLIGAIFRTAWDQITGVITGAWDLIKSVVMGGINFVLSFLTTQLNAIIAVFTFVWNLLSGIVNSVWEGIKNTVRDGINGVLDFFRQLPGRILGFATDVFNAAKSIGGKVIDGIVSGIGAVAGIAGDIGKAVLHGIAVAVNTVIDLVQGGINSAIDLANEIPFVDIDHVTLPHLKFHEGGIVPGPVGKEVPAMLLGGEEVRTIDQQKADDAARNVTITSYLTVAPPEGMSKDDSMELARVTAAENARQIEAVIGTI